MKATGFSRIFWFAKDQIKNLGVKSLISLIFAAIFIVLLPFSWNFPLGKPFAYGILQMYVSPVLYVTDFGIIGLIIAFLLRGKKEVQYPAEFHRIFWPLLGLALLAFLFATFSLNVDLAYYSAFRWLLTAFIFLLIYHLDIPNTQLVTLIICSLFIQAVVGIIQAIVQRPLGLPGELTLGLDNTRVAALYLTGITWLRSYGLTFHPNVLGGFLACGLLLLLPRLNRKIYWFTWMIFLAGLILTFSRSAWVSAAIIIPLLILWFIRKSINPIKLNRSRVIYLGIGFGLVLLLFSRQIIARINPFSSQAEIGSIVGRVELIRFVVDEIKIDPITGIGAGNFPVAMLNFNTSDDPHYVHNIMLLLTAEIGILGGLIWLWLWIYPALKLQPALKNHDALPIVLVATWFAWGIIGLWDSYPWALESGRLFSITLLALIARES
ncbi:MAG: O-antigen ligase family protein [Candidatus Helarchaeota archaeon]|nr:O-antigen ligase family protein [Candidatus Helarchaeota archaeon]